MPPIARQNGSIPDIPPSLLGALAGGVLLVLGIRRRGAGGTVAGVMGAGLLAANIPPLADELIDAGNRRRAVSIRETLVFNRPVAELFAFCSNFENFPRLTSFLERVHDYDDGRSRWVVRTPTGRLLEWEAIVTKYMPQQVIGWESVKGSAVRSSGLVRFYPEGPSRTRVDISIRYAPERTSAVDALASLLGPARSARLRTDLANAGGQPLRLAAD